MSASKDNEVGPFTPTQWSLVMRAGQPGIDARQAPLGILLQRYLPALRAHLRIDKRLSADRVEDLLQGFIADKIVEQNLIASADPGRGKFRSFLLIALNRYVIDDHRRARARENINIPFASVFDSEKPEFASRDAEASLQFDIVWARELIAHSLREMKAECEQSGRPDLWGIFECRIVMPAFDGIEPLAYDKLIEQFRLATPLDAYNLLTTAKRMFARILRAVTSEYVVEPELIDQEITDLKLILSRAGA